MPIIKEWEHAGMTCALRHGAFDAPCGYVAVPEGHPLHGVQPKSFREFIDSPLHSIDVHGGVTFHRTMRNDPEQRWWVGFDMAHYDDFDEYDHTRCIRTDDECIAETNRLAEQLAKMGSE